MRSEVLAFRGKVYEPCRCKNERREFAGYVQSNLHGLFGRSCVLLPEETVASVMGTTSRPDAFVLTYGPVPRWYIVEFELWSPRKVDHIINQLNRHMKAIVSGSSKTSGKLWENLSLAIKSIWPENATNFKTFSSPEAFARTVMANPVFLLIIDRLEPQLVEQLESLPSRIIKREFEVFREKGSNAKAFRFKPLPTTVRVKCKKCGKVDPVYIQYAKDRRYHVYQVFHYPDGRLQKHYWGTTPPDVPLD